MYIHTLSGLGLGFRLALGLGLGLRFMPRQLILRLPLGLADRLRSLLRSGELDENTASCKLVNNGNNGGDQQSHGGTKSRENNETSKVRKVEKSNEGTKPGFRWVFTLGGESYPARLVNLPTNVETHKTVDKVTYYKSSDIGQMMVVYEVSLKASLL